MYHNDKLILVGFISSCSGLRGEVVVKSYTQNLEDVCKLPLITDKGIEVSLRLIRRNSKGGLICSLNSVSDRTSSEKWVKKKLFCNRSDLPQIKFDEFYIEDLKNLKVIDLDGNKIGTILNIHNFKAGNIVELKFNDGKIIMLPFTNNFFSQITDTYAVCTAKNFEY